MQNQKIQTMANHQIQNNQNINQIPIQKLPTHQKNMQTMNQVTYFTV